MGIADGYYALVLSATALVLLSLFLFIHVEHWMDRINQARYYKITTRYTPNQLAQFENTVKAHHLKVKRLKQRKSGDTLTGTWLLTGSKKAHQLFTTSMLQDADVVEILF
jgi:putative Mg2+ transporter-C (MgtC) family protein